MDEQLEEYLDILRSGNAPDEPMYVHAADGLAAEAREWLRGHGIDLSDPSQREAILGALAYIESVRVSTPEDIPGERLAFGALRQMIVGAFDLGHDDTFEVGE